eukprot:TRINITY_DN16615_c0_g3_i2.p1 TRINITY_DN16615_c0_g3~~TRINITY_DN16615_c0_g3_i2.p1  ORF type:complete len:109 (+),score=18.02 TRINITY_DN16615_c0_g3_i2:196-522(+)
MEPAADPEQAAPTNFSSALIPSPQAWSNLQEILDTQEKALEALQRSNVKLESFNEVFEKTFQELDFFYSSHTQRVANISQDLRQIFSSIKKLRQQVARLAPATQTPSS